MKSVYPSLFLFVTIITLFACGSDTNKNAAPDAKPSQEKVAEKIDTAKWIDDFSAFRDAVYQNDRKKVKTFVDFPITEHTNYIWGIVGVDYKLDDSIPFTEKDFDKYYDKLFTKTFIKCLLKIKSEELYKKGKISSPVIKEEEINNTLYADVENNTLTLNLASKGVYKTEEGESDTIEYNVMFSFIILKSGKLRLHHMMAAG